MSRTRSRETEDPLQTLFQRSDKAEVFTDLEIDEVSRILHDSRLPGGDCPRTYIVLRTIGQLNLLDTFIKLGFDDQWFPIGTRSLPSLLSPAIRNAFANAQSVVLTKSLDVEHGRHRHFTPGEPLPFEIGNRLGSGGYSQVDRIHSRISKRSYALKRIRRRKVFGNDTKEAMKRFKSEVDIMRGLKHQHIVHFVGSYTDKTYLGIITSPVADMDLAAFLTRLCGSIRAGSGPEKVVASEMSSTLRSFFGCLAAALAYLHDTKNQRSINLAELLVRMSSSMTAGQGLQSTRLAPISQTNKDRSAPGKGKVESPGQNSSPTNAASSADDTSVAQDGTSSQGNVAFAVFDYKRQASNEIDLIQGEVITDLVQHESGWSYGQRRNGNHGWFPSAYVAMQISGESSSYEAPKHVSGLGLNQPWFRGVVHVPKDASEPQEALRKIWHAARNSQRKEGGDLAPLIRPKLAMPHLPEAVLCTATKLDHRMRSVLLKARILAS